MQAQIQEILRRENLTSSQFADRIGVQRSSVSHVISGRNKPGFDFINKILLAFPDINANWLITGDGEMYGERRTQDTSLTFDIPVETEKVKSVKTDEPGEPSAPTTSDPSPIASKSSEIERIIVFYKDKTFREYREES